MATNGKVTLAILGIKLDALTKVVEDHVKKDEDFQDEWREAINGCDEYPGIRGRLDRVEQLQRLQKWISGTITVAGIGSFFAWLKGH